MTKPVQVTSLGVNVGRLRNAVRSLLESPSPKVNMGSYAICGSPACVLGHYASRTDLQDTFELSKDWLKIKDTCNVAPGQSLFADFNGSYVQGHFGIDTAASFELFSTRGCGRADTTAAAAKYLEAFIKDEIRLGVNAKRYGWDADKVMLKREDLETARRNDARHI